MRPSITTDNSLSALTPHAERARQRADDVPLHRADPVVVVRIPGGEHPLVLCLHRIPLAVTGEASAAVVKHQHIISQHVAQPAPKASLREIDLLAVAGGKGEIEITDQLQRATADVHAVSDDSREARADPQ